MTIMRKREFLDQLRKGRSGLPREDLEERLTFYGEMIDDRVEDGLTEDEAVAGIGTVSEVVSQIAAEIPLSKLVKERVRSKRALRAWEIVLLALGAPVWLPLSFAALAILLAVYAVIWSLAVSLWAVEASLAGCALGGAISGAVSVLRDGALPGLALLGAGIFCAGASVFLFFGCKEATKGIFLLTKRLFFGIKSLFLGKEAVS